MDEASLYSGTSLIRNRAPPRDHHRALGIALLWGPTGRRFLMDKVSLQWYLAHKRGTHVVSLCARDLFG